MRKGPRGVPEGHILETTGICYDKNTDCNRVAGDEVSRLSEKDGFKKTLGSIVRAVEALEPLRIFRVASQTWLVVMTRSDLPDNECDITDVELIRYCPKWWI